MTRPVAGASSTSHLVLTQTVLRGHFGVDLPQPESPEMVLVDLVVHVGTLVSIVVVMTTACASALVGSLALWLVLRLLETARFRGFSVYVWVLAAAALLAGPALDAGHL